MSKVKVKDTSWQFIHDTLPIKLDDLILEVLSFTDEWKIDTSRQDKLATHKDTEMFQLKFISYYWEKGQGDISENINYLKTEKSKNVINLIFKYLEDKYEGKVVRAEIIKMHGRGHIQPHIDSGEFLSLARRIHVPLVTNENVTFTILNSDINMKVGEWYEINNSLPHSVDNQSDMDRIHIIIDILENKLLDYKND